MDIQKGEDDFNAWFNKQTINAVPDADLSLQRLWASLAWQAQAAKAQAVPEWISVEDGLPKKNANVLLNVVARRRGKPFSCIGFYSVEPDDEPCFILDDNSTILKGVTHWMSLPDAPKPQEPAND